MDGGPNFYANYSSGSLPSDIDFFPIGVWSEAPENAERVKQYGINTYVGDYESADAIVAAGLYNLAPLDDEADMRFGPGSDRYDPKSEWPNSCKTAKGKNQDEGAKCGYTAMEQHQSRVVPGELRYANYGKGIMFWESDDEARKFVNDFQDVVSADIYWETDADVCGASQGGRFLLGLDIDLDPTMCRRPANYGLVVDKVRRLVKPAGSRPVYNFVELGHPFVAGETMPVSAIRPAVWSSLIHGARGIVYFNHSFGGSCPTHHVLDDCDKAIAAEVTALNGQITRLARPLNSPSVRNVTTTGGIDARATWDGSEYYVFSGSTALAGSTTGSIRVPGLGSGTAEVVDENRSVPIVGGTITDTWGSPEAVHIYKVSS